MLLRTGGKTAFPPSKVRKVAGECGGSAGTEGALKVPPQPAWHKQRREGRS